MGAQQSSAGADSGGTHVISNSKTCYYELLGVSRDATEDEIKKAYRRKALELHPDRNLDDVEAATRRFAEIQSAHEILSDPQDRAWYDDHRDAILSGQDASGDGTEPTTFRNVRLTTTEEIMSLMRKFNANVPFNDEPTGFYGIARETFEHLALEEEAAAEYADIASPGYPTFGSSDDDYEAVVKPFYNSWAGFSSLKSFSWKDKYRLSDAPDRRVRRLMGKENKKLREDAIREFNDAVRFLVTFVCKRDPRYIPNTQSEADRQKNLRDAAVRQAARSRAANNEKFAEYQLPDWVQQGNGEAGFFSEESEDEDGDIEILECIVCDKAFKSSKQLEAHERSKKHQKAVNQLRRHLRKEGKDLDLDMDSRKPEEPETADHDGTDDNLTHECSPGSDEEGINVCEIGHKTVSDSELEESVSVPIGKLSISGGNIKATESDVTVDDDGAITPLQETNVDDRPAKKIGMAKLKREKKAAAQKHNSEEHRCTVCASAFASKTKLFTHIREEGHAMAVPVASGKGKKRNR